MRKITIYNDYYKDEIMATYDMNTTQAKEFIDKILSGSNFDILITSKEFE